MNRKPPFVPRLTSDEDCMKRLEAKLANITAVEHYGNAMKAKGLHARAKWAYDEARRLRRATEAVAGFQLPKVA